MEKTYSTVADHVFLPIQGETRNGSYFICDQFEKSFLEVYSKSSETSKIEPLCKNS